MPTAQKSLEKEPFDKEQKKDPIDEAATSMRFGSPKRVGAALCLDCSQKGYAVCRCPSQKAGNDAGGNSDPKGENKSPKDDPKETNKPITSEISKNLASPDCKPNNSTSPDEDEMEDDDEINFITSDKAKTLTADETHKYKACITAKPLDSIELLFHKYIAELKQKDPDDFKAQNFRAEIKDDVLTLTMSAKHLNAFITLAYNKGMILPGSNQGQMTNQTQSKQDQKAAQNNSQSPTPFKIILKPGI